MATSDAEEKVPPSFICPLTLEVMTDPVTAADGHSYENEAISKWLRTSRLSPLTNEPLPNKRLTRSHALRNAIEEYQAQAAARSRLAAQAAARQPGVAGGAKVILLGDSNVGKTSLVYRVKEGTFSEAAGQPTIGCSFYTHAVPMAGGGRLGLAIWDTAGQEKYRSFTRQYFRGASAAVVLYDVTSAASFEGAKRWLREVKAELSSSPGWVLCLVGSKLDCAATREVPPAAAAELAAAEEAEHIECSAKDGTNVDAVFQLVARALLSRGLAQPEGKPAALGSQLGSQLGSVPLDGGGTRPVAVAGCCQQ